MIQVRNVPDEVHRALKARAALNGLSLSDLCLDELRQVAERPTIEDIHRRVSQFARLSGDGGAAEAVRAERDGR